MIKNIFMKVAGFVSFVGIAACGTTTDYDEITRCATISKRSWYGSYKSLHVECMDGTIVDNGEIVRRVSRRYEGGPDNRVSGD
ncbi:hypothetical protein [Burkholderia pyrrocinia]|uniref:hypothetical protein n=1 Tax=Burkholderia pyrrocinia TaxID=60550 RepID=UPI0010531D68|nr:hypothetical protein [Burkholderia pyrrocinia]TDA48269.1 hypothetical protein EVG18_06225 [Burkholderia pyrrocinia]